MRSTCCALVIVLTPACAMTPTPHEVRAPRASSQDERPVAPPSRTDDVPRGWRRPSDGARPWRAWQFVPDDARQRRRYDYDPERREYRIGEDRVVPEVPGERCPGDDDLGDLLPDGEA